MNIKCKLTISRYRDGARDEKPVAIRVQDASSGCEFVEVRVGLEEFAEALFGLGYVEAEAEVQMEAPIGKIYEHKTVVIPKVPRDLRNDPKKIAAVLKPYEVDGWRGRKDDVTNPHNWRGDGSAIIFTRYVDAKEPE